MEQVGGSSSSPLHTSTNVWLCLSVFTAPAMYAAGAMMAADVRDAPPNAHGACRCSSHLSPSLEVIPHSVWAISISNWSYLFACWNVAPGGIARSLLVITVPDRFCRARLAACLVISGTRRNAARWSHLNLASVFRA